MMNFAWKLQEQAHAGYPEEGWVGHAEGIFRGAVGQRCLLRISNVSIENAEIMENFP